MNELDIVDRLSIHRTMSQYLTGGQLLLALNCDRAEAKVEIERLRTQAELHEAEIAELVAALNSLVENAEGFSVSGVYFNELAENRKVLDGAYDAIAKYEVKS